MGEVWNLVVFLLRPSADVPSARRRMALVLLFGGVSGVLSTVLVMLINRALLKTLDLRVLWGFIACCILLPLTRYLSQILLINLSQETVLGLRMRLCRRILASPLQLLESIGPHRILATLTEDVTNVREIATLIPLLVMHLTVVVGCLFYVTWLSWRVLLVVAVFTAFGVFAYRLAIRRATWYFRRVREGTDRMIRYFRGLSEGLKELKLHRPRRGGFLAGLLGATRDIQQDTTAANKIFALANSGGQVLSFALIGLLFILYRDTGWLSGRTMAATVLIILYMRSPLDVSLQMLPSFNRAGVSLAKINRLGLALGAAADTADERSVPAPPAAGWQRLELAGVAHSYRREDEEAPFTLGPIDLAITPGELLFVVGGNGSGKTTLAKLILGLYQPEAGEILFDGQRMDETNREFYLQHFTAVFSDFFLFDSLLGMEHNSALDAQARHYLGMLHLERKVRVEGGCLSTTDLSQGQRKRLALLTAYLEDRSIYLFDEWAADQDPYFKEIFYLELLPQLKARGKTVIVISHDDRYYDGADRIIKMEDGRIAYDGRYSGYQDLAALAAPAAPARLRPTAGAHPAGPALVARAGAPDLSARFSSQDLNRSTVEEIR